MASNLQLLTGNPTYIGQNVTSGGSRTALALDSEFINGTSGDAICIRYTSLFADTLGELYLFMISHGGTIANLSLSATIYGENTSYRLRPPTSGALWSGTVTATFPDNDNKWVKLVFNSPYTTSVGEIIWIVVYNNATSKTVDYPGIQYNTTVLAIRGLATEYGVLAPVYSTAGFSSNGTIAQKMPFVLKHGTAYVGWPFTQIGSTYYSDNQLERGFQFTPTEDVTVCGVECSVGDADFSYARILDDSTLPGGTALYSYDMDSDTGQTTADAHGGKIFATAVTLTGGTTYKLTLTYHANSRSPSVLQIEDYSSYSSVFDALRAQDTFRTPWGVISDGGSPAAWTTDKAICPTLALLVSDFPLQSGGGLITHPGMVGGACG